MTMRPVHWHEGMFLRPHHFQAAQRQQDHLLARNEKWTLHHNWGLRSIDLDLDALANYRLVVRSLEVRLRDGAAAVLPDEGLLPALDITAASELASTSTIYLATTHLLLITY